MSMEKIGNGHLVKKSYRLTVIIFSPYPATNTYLIQREANNVEWVFEEEVNRFRMKSAKIQEAQLQQLKEGVRTKLK